MTRLPVDFFVSPRDMREGRVKFPAIGTMFKVPHAAPGTGANTYVVVANDVKNNEVLAADVVNVRILR